MAQRGAVKEVFMRTLQFFAGKPEGVAFSELEGHFQKHHHVARGTMIGWLQAQTGQVRREHGRVYVVQDAHIATRLPTQPRLSNATELRRGHRTKGTGAGRASIFHEKN